MRSPFFAMTLVLLVGGVTPSFAQVCKPPSRNVLTVCSSEGGGSTACKEAISEANVYCVCMGYERFSTAEGDGGKCVNPTTKSNSGGSFFSALPSGSRGSILVGTTGFLMGSLSDRTGEEKTRDLKAWTGVGVATGALFEALVSPTSNPVVLAVAAGAGAYVGAQAIGEEREAQNLQTAEDTRKQTGAAAAGAAVAVGGIALIKKATGFRWTPPRSLRRLRVSLAGNGAWMRWSW